MDPPTAEDLGITPQQFGILQKVSKMDMKLAYLHNSLEIQRKPDQHELYTFYHHFCVQ